MIEITCLLNIWPDNSVTKHWTLEKTTFSESLCSDEQVDMHFNLIRAIRFFGVLYSSHFELANSWTNYSSFLTENTRQAKQDNSIKITDNNIPFLLYSDLTKLTWKPRAWNAEEFSIWPWYHQIYGLSCLGIRLDPIVLRSSGDLFLPSGSKVVGLTFQQTGDNLKKKKKKKDNRLADTSFMKSTFP